MSALQRYFEESGAHLSTVSRVSGITTAGGRATGVIVDNRSLPASAVVLATGGASYPETGSSGDGFDLAAKLGHTIVGLRPALVPLIVRELAMAKSMQGISLKSVRVSAYQCEASQVEPSMWPASDYGRGLSGRKVPAPLIEARTGEVMITHFGLSGPAVLSMSLAVVDALAQGPVSLAVDLYPALDLKDLQKRLQDRFDRYGKRSLRHHLDTQVPHKLVDPFIEAYGFSPDRLGHQIQAQERERLALRLKSILFNIKAPLPISSAMVTAGGVSLKEIDPRTMASRLVKGLYLCGEVIDIDAGTGGYNLQAAFSTGYVAGEESARAALGSPD